MSKILAAMDIRVGSENGMVKLKTPFTSIAFTPNQAIALATELGGEALALMQNEKEPGNVWKPVEPKGEILTTREPGWIDVQNRDTGKTLSINSDRIVIVEEQDEGGKIYVDGGGVGLTAVVKETREQILEKIRKANE